MVTKRESTAERHRQAARLYVEGELSLNEVGRHFNVTGGAVLKWLKAQEIPRRQAGGSTGRRSERARVEARRDRAVAAYPGDESADVIARREGVDRTTILKDLRLRGVEIRPGGRGNRTAQERAEIDRRILELRHEGKRPLEIVSLLGLGSRRRVDEVLRAAGLAFTSGAQRRLPEPKERPCERCGELFRPRSSGDPGRFCSRDCHYASSAQRAVGEKAARERHGQSRIELEHYKSDLDLLEASEVGELLGLQCPSVLGYYEKRGLTVAEVFTAHGDRFRLYRRDDALRFQRDWLTGGGVERARWRDPRFRCQQAERRGELHRLVESLRLTHDRTRFPTENEAEEDLLEEARTLWVRRDHERRKPLRQRRRGRKRSQGPPAHHIVWADLAREKRDELQHEYEERKALDLLAEGDRPPTKADVFEAVAEDERGLRHLPEHYRQWDEESGCFVLNPALAESAIEVIEMAIKRLQKRGTEISQT
jgi:hypothetical protein